MTSEALTQTIRDVPQAWGNLGRTRQLVAGGVAAVVVLGLVAALIVFQQPAQVPLYTNLNDADGAAIVGKLKEMKVPYQVVDGGSTIKVSQAQAADLRLQLAGAGLPSGSGVGIVGMEVFDRTNLGITDFAQRLNYQRGLEGELTRTINRLSAVESARVHLVLPQERLFTAQQRDTTASVVVRLKPGARLSDEQVSNIRFLVSKAVEGLKADNVAVVDVNGNALGKLDSTEMARDEQVANRQKVQHQRESELESKIQGMLTQVLGPNKAVVRANVTLDWNEVTQNIETYSPGTTQPQVLSERDKREQFTGRGTDVPVPGGVPGTQANIPTYQVAGGAGGDSAYTASDVQRNFQLSSDRQNITRAPGDIRNIGIAVMVDQSVQAAQVEQITQVVTAAAGIQPQRGDQVSVVTLPFDTSLSQQLKQQQEEQTLMDYIALGLRVGGIVIGLGGLFLLFRMMSSAVRPRPQPVVVAESLALPGGTAGLLPPVQVQQQLEEVMQTGRMRGDVEAQLRERVREEVAAELRAEYEAQVQARLREIEEAEVARERQEQIEAAKQDASRREQMRAAVTKLATAKPEALAEVLNQWLEQSRAAQQPVRRFGAAPGAN